MSALDIKQIETVVNEIVAVAKGEKANGGLPYGDFTTCATTALQMDVNQINNGISQVLSRTIFSVRPYTALYKGLYKDAEKWGNHVRKLVALDDEMEKDQRIYKGDGSVLANGDSVDMYTIKKTDVLQTNFYGFTQYQKHKTIWKDQLDTAFSGPEQFGNFISMVMTSASDQLEQAREELARGTLVNLVAGTHALGGTQVVHLLTEYNIKTGLQFTKETIMQPDNFKPFMQWVFSRFQDLMDALRERGVLYHANPTVSKKLRNIPRHTPYERQHAYLLSTFINQSANMMESNTFNDKYLSKMDSEKVVYWQDPTDPYMIKQGTTFNYMDKNTGLIKKGTVEADLSSVIGIIFDDDAIGINLYNNWTGTTPFNVAGGYTNYFWHEGNRCWVDNTENAIVICLD